VAATGSRDGALIEAAAGEGRLLLTRDRRMLERREAGGTVLVLEGGRLAEQAAELRERLMLDWTAAPFTRCLVDNAPLVEAEGIPPRYQGRNIASPLSSCPACGRLYWVGSHVRRMRTRLEEWAGHTI
jgi:uncharacterized protein with PIN domain